jgi:hypothetical protein
MLTLSGLEVGGGRDVVNREGLRVGGGASQREREREREREISWSVGKSEWI